MQPELSPLAKSWRLAVLATVTALLTWGTVWGTDDAWPFGPFRMYATSSPATGSISVVAVQVLEAGSAQWRDVEVAPSTLGMNRAEIEGRLPALLADPSRLRTLAAARARLHPSASPWTGVRLVRRTTAITDRRPARHTTDTVLETWTKA